MSGARSRPAGGRQRLAPPVVAFLGPSLPAAEARALADCLVLPPARQGDVWRSLALRPRAIALVDGLFEAQPSVWHHELLAALDAGVAVFGGASMGALRAAELSFAGMVGVGQIFRWVEDGTIVDDSEVALLHADAEHDHRPLTVPLVNVRHAAARARAARLLSSREASALVEAGEQLFYQERSWRRILATARLSADARRRFERFASPGLPDLKREDAVATILAAAAFAGANRPLAGGTQGRPSSLVRRRRIAGARTPAGPLPALVAALRRRADAASLLREGRSRALLAAFARQLGLAPTLRELAAAEAAWLTGAGVLPGERTTFLASCALDEGEARALVEALALEELVLSEAARLVPDGPSPDEALLQAAQVRGLLRPPGPGAHGSARPGRR